MRKFLWIIIFNVLLMPQVRADGAQVVLPEVSKKAFAIISPAFKEGERIPTQFTCKGADVNPALIIQNAPEGTKSFALTVFDPKGVVGPWVHWIVFNIRPNTEGISQNEIPGMEALNDFGNFYYSRPCLADRREHEFIFTLYALDQVLVDLTVGATRDTLLKEIKGKVLGVATLTGVYQSYNWE